MGSAGLWRGDVILAFYAPFFGEAAWAALPEEGDPTHWARTGIIPGTGAAAVAGFLAGYRGIGCWAAPAAVVIAPDDGSGVEAMREWFNHPRTDWVMASTAMAQSALDEMIRAEDPLAVWLREGEESPHVLRAAALAWKERRRCRS